MCRLIEKTNRGNKILMARPAIHAKIKAHFIFLLYILGLNKKKFMLRPNFALLLAVVIAIFRPEILFIS